MGTASAVKLASTRSYDKQADDAVKAGDYLLDSKGVYSSRLNSEAGLKGQSRHMSKTAVVLAAPVKEYLDGAKKPDTMSRDSQR